MPSTIRLGSSGDDVRKWQRVLGVDDDGIFGPDTDGATRSWQMQRGIEPDGVVGPTTWSIAGFDAPNLVDEVVKGTDVSAIQGVRPASEWKQMAEMGVRFAIMRTIVGNETWNDTAAVENMRRARAHGIRCMPYVFAFPLPHLAPEKQVEDFVARLERMGGMFEEGTVALDLEWPPPEERAKDGTIVDTWAKWKCSPAQLREWSVRALDRGESLTGRRWLVYSYRYWLRRIEAHLAKELGDRPLWLADATYAGRWPSAAEISRLSTPDPWDRIAIVQHDGNGGLRMPSGMDADFNVFLGGEAELDSFMKGEHVEEAVPPTVRNDDRGVLIDPAVQFSTLRLITEDGISAYRRERFDESEAS